MESQPKKSPLNDYAIYSNIGIEMAIIIAMGVFGGIKLDKWLGCSPLSTLIFSILGVGIALYVMIKGFTPKQKKKDE